MSNVITIPDGIKFATITAAKTEELAPRHYRLMKKKSGELVLQGAFYWHQGWDKAGFEWRDIHTEIEE